MQNGIQSILRVTCLPTLCKTNMFSILFLRQPLSKVCQLIYCQVQKSYYCIVNAGIRVCQHLQICIILFWVLHIYSSLNEYLLKYGPLNAVCLKRRINLHAKEIAQQRMQLVANGKTKRQVLETVRHQWLCLCFGVLKASKSLDPTLLRPNP